MDEVRIWNLPRTQTDIRDAMHKQLTGGETGLVAYYQCNTNSGTVLADLTTNANTGTLTSGSVWTNGAFPCANLIADRANLRGAWLAQTNSLASSLLSVTNAALSSTNFRVFGHDGGALTQNTSDKPAPFAWRLNRTWQVEGPGAVTGDLAFDCTSLAGLIGNPGNLRLLADADGAFANATPISGAYAGNVFHVASQTLSNGTYYTLGEWATRTITASASNGGSISPVGAVYVPYGGTTNFIIAPDAYYHVTDVTTNGISVGAVTSFTWTSITTDGTINANFAADLSAKGTPHWWLAQYGWTNNFDIAEASDTDHDGHTAGQEYVADTNPTNAASCFHIESITNLPPLTVRFLSSSNRVYSLWRATNLDSAPWLVLPGQSNVAGTGGVMSLADTNAVPPIRFYRVKVTLP